MFSGKVRHRATSLLRSASALAAASVMAIGLAACAAFTGEEQAKLSRIHSVVRLEAVPAYLLVVPARLPVWLWDRPGGPSARAVRIASVPSGTTGRVVAYEPAPGLMAWRVQWGVPDPGGYQPVRWAKVVTPRAEGWVRIEFLVPEGEAPPPGWRPAPVSPMSEVPSARRVEGAASPLAPPLAAEKPKNSAQTGKLSPVGSAPPPAPAMWKDFPDKTTN